MKALKFKEQNIEIAKNQPEYNTLPALASDNGDVVFGFELSSIEKAQIALTGQIWVQLKTFKNPMQPIFITPFKGDLIQSLNPANETSLIEEYYDIEKANDSAVEIVRELMRAKRLFPPKFVNQHEAYAVILEEIDELWTEIKMKQSNYDLKAQKKEAVQSAAMLLRLIVELL